MGDLSLSQRVCAELKTRFRLDYKGTYFRIWKRNLDFVFSDNKVKYVLTEPIPDKETDPVAHQKFLHDDFTARHIILGSLHQNLFLSYLHHQTAKSLLDALTSLFTKPSVANEHVLEMRRMATELGLEGVEVPEELQAVVLMNSLPDSWYDAITTMIGNMDTDERGLTLVNAEIRVRNTGGWKKIFSTERARNDETMSISRSSIRSSKRGSFRGKW